MVPRGHRRDAGGDQQSWPTLVEFYNPGSWPETMEWCLALRLSSEIVVGESNEVALHLGLVLGGGVGGDP